MSGEPIPPGSLPLAARAPGKCILFGEHAVVHGRPELVLAIDLPVQVGVQSAVRSSLNRDFEATERHPYFRAALKQLWADGPPIEVRVQSRVPRAAGLGSSAAFSAALAATLSSARGGISRAGLAERAFAVERAAQGVGSPGDTAASVAGGYVSLNGPGGEVLSEYTDGNQSWTARRVHDPSWSWVVAYSGLPRSTADAVRAVGERLKRSDGPELLDRFARVAESGIRAVVAEDREAVGTLLDENQLLLAEVGVSHPQLEKLLRAARPTILGGKLTGAGAGGSVVVLPLPGRELDAARRMARAGGLPFVVRPESEGASLVARPVEPAAPTDE
ncbi:MAG: mevalonate kinase [Thermoplasmata archaeon]|nr:mevalonate kinase [Thermoplasmata archaeon]MCI4355942.1 mevalonate kinase [Thermoplasmata archaeon]